MSPNLFLATQKLFSPHKWFRESKSPRNVRKTEYWADGPVPGMYEYLPGRGWYLIATLKDVTPPPTPPETEQGGPVQPPASKEYVKLDTPIQAHYSRVLKRYLLEPEYRARKRSATITGETGKPIEVSFFRLDDGIAWVLAWDEHGDFVPGPYKLWCHSSSGSFRHMRKGDDPNFAGSRTHSRAPSFDAASRSTEFRTTGPSTANPSARATPAGSKAGSRAGSRRSSPRRNGSAQLEEVAAMRRMAREHHAAVAAAAAADRGRGRATVY